MFPGQIMWSLYLEVMWPLLLPVKWWLTIGMFCVKIPAKFEWFWGNNGFIGLYNLSRSTTKKAKENDLCAQPGLPHSLSASRNIGSLGSYSAHSEDSTQTRQMRRLIWVISMHTCHFVAQLYFSLSDLRYNLQVKDRRVQWAYKGSPNS